MEAIRVSAIAMENWIGEQDRTIAHVDEWTGRATADGAELVVFPELCVSGYMHSTDALKYSEPIPGPSTARLIEVAKKHNCILCYGILENESDIAYNTQVVVNGDGIIGTQRKIHMPGPEYMYWRGGFDIQPIDIGKAKLGITICYDSLFAEMARTLYFRGAEILVMPFAYNTPGERATRADEDISVLTYRVHCWTNGCYGIVVNNAGEHEKMDFEDSQLTFPGWAGVFGPGGDIMEWTREPGNGEAMVTADLEPNALVDRRKDCYFPPRCLRPGMYESLNKAGY